MTDGYRTERVLLSVLLKSFIISGLTMHRTAEQQNTYSPVLCVRARIWEIILFYCSTVLLGLKSLKSLNIGRTGRRTGLFYGVSPLNLGVFGGTHGR